ncbi:hypothetical protein BBH88_11105 [Planococcus antarcticus DSM 14505]|uniref:Uncharacterized protein n=1 Tax=Planococcus antarcticus DSM 14505 TaxID=1185653 RepID=A0ABM6D6R7_9BACL|nr:hypothetical protein [Planococcus antarcticus]ANU10818.2 hypothetical protein BBH88_11105 [Planococcus antarcticus DSM 14505]
MLVLVVFIYVADTEREITAVIKLDNDNTISYESKKHKNLLKVLHMESNEIIESTLDKQEIRSLGDDVENLSNLENMMPAVLMFNGASMGLEKVNQLLNIL